MLLSLPLDDDDGDDDYDDVDDDESDGNDGVPLLNSNGVP